MSKAQKTPVGLSVRGVVVKAGGPAAVANALGLSHQSVRNWRTVPAKHAETVAHMAHLPLSVVRPELVAPSVSQRAHK